MVQITSKNQYVEVFCTNAKLLSILVNRSLGITKCDTFPETLVRLKNRELPLPEYPVHSVTQRRRA